MKIKLVTPQGTIEAEVPEDTTTITAVLDPAEDGDVDIIDVAIQVERAGVDDRTQLLGTWINHAHPTFGELVVIK